jgi:hypothetical protein
MSYHCTGHIATNRRMNVNCESRRILRNTNVTEKCEQTFRHKSFHCTGMSFSEMSRNMTVM